MIPELLIVLAESFVRVVTVFSYCCMVTNIVTRFYRRKNQISHRMSLGRLLKLSKWKTS